MKPPGWMVAQPPLKGTLSADGHSVVFTFRIRKWHPGLWWAIFQRWRR